MNSKHLLILPIILLLGIFAAKAQNNKINDDYHPLVQEGKIWSVPINIFAQDIVWKRNFGSYVNVYNSITAISDGTITVGTGSFFDLGDWEGVEGKGDSDAIIVKYDNIGNVVWKKNFGGEKGDNYTSVTTVFDGIVAVGASLEGSFNTGDWMGISGKGNADAIIVKYNNIGNVVWKRNFGGKDHDLFSSVTTVSDGIVAVGQSYGRSFDTGDWEGVSAKGGEIDAIIVKFDHTGNVIWKKNFGGNGWTDSYYCVTAMDDGIVAVGISYADSFGNGDWEGIPGKGGVDAIVVKYDHTGNVIWKKNFGGSGGDAFNSLTTVSDGIVAVGYSFINSDGDWQGFTKKGSLDAIIVKFDHVGDVLWKNNFGGNFTDRFESVTEVSDGVIIVGVSGEKTFGSGDWEGVSGHYSGTEMGTTDAIIVKYDNTGNVVWKKNFGGADYDKYNSVTTVANSVVAVGYSDYLSFGNGDWENVSNKGYEDAIIVKYTIGGVGIPELPQESNIKVYPNPSTGELSIENYELRIKNIEILDVSGRKLLSHISQLTPQISINISHLQAGIYFVKIITEQGEIVKKVVKH